MMSQPYRIFLLLLLGVFPCFAGIQTSLAQSEPLRRQNLSPYGKPCLKVTGDSRAAFSQPQVSEHWAIVQNSCSKVITGKICYQDTQRCKSFSVAGYQRENVFLGSAFLQSYFKFNVEEKVDQGLF